MHFCSDNQGLACSSPACHGVLITATASYRCKRQSPPCADADSVHVTAKTMGLSIASGKQPPDRAPWPDLFQFLPPGCYRCMPMLAHAPLSQGAWSLPGGATHTACQAASCCLSPSPPCRCPHPLKLGAASACNRGSRCSPPALHRRLSTLPYVHPALPLPDRAALKPGRPLAAAAARLAPPSSPPPPA